MLHGRGARFRILALSATPGNDYKRMQVGGAAVLVTVHAHMAGLLSWDGIDGLWWHCSSQ